MNPTQQIHNILQKHKIAIEHSEDSITEAQQWLVNPGTDDPALVDWSAEAFVTIDNPDSRDLDQALLIEKDAADGYRVRYALADAAHYVRTGSALFKEALSRGVTYYTPLMAASMLPPVLSEGLVSLNPQVDRRALVFDMRLGTGAEVFSTQIVRARIRSHAKLSYGSVQSFINARTAAHSHEYDTQPFADSLQLLKTVGELLMQRALDRNVVPFNRREPEITVDENDRFTMRHRVRVDSEKYNEQISLLCNMQGAELLSSLLEGNPDLQAVFRVHDAPMRSRLSSLRQLLNEFAEQIGGQEYWRWQTGQSLAAYVSALPDDPEYAGFVQAIERQVLVSNQASEFNSEPGRHHALGASSYARFSSPMREIVGIFTHKELLEVLEKTHAPAGQQHDQTTHDDELLRVKVIAIANEAKQIQKRLDKAIEFIALHDILAADLETGEITSRPGTIMGFKRDRMYIACDDIACDLKLDRRDLERQWQCAYSFDTLYATPADPAAPRWHLGQRVLVSTLAFEAERRHFRLGLETVPVNCGRQSQIKR